MLAGLAGFVSHALRKVEGAARRTVRRHPRRPARRQRRAAGKARAAHRRSAPPERPRRHVRARTSANSPTIDVFAIEIGYGLLSLADAKNNGDLLARVTGVRRSLARERGVIVPPISVRDNLELEANDYRFLLRGKVIARGQIMPGRWLAMNVTNSNVRLRGVPTREPVFNLDATWIAEEEKKTAEINGFTVVDAPSVLVTHLSETLKTVAHHLLGRQDVQILVDHLKESHPALVSELLPDLVNLGIIQRVLQNLLRENVAILNLPLDPRMHRRFRLALQEPG